jgi:hypothetical protein
MAVVRVLADWIIVIIFSLFICVVVVGLPLKIEVVQRLTFFSGITFLRFIMVVLALIIFLIVFLHQIRTKGGLKSLKGIGLMRMIIIYFRVVRFLVLKFFYFYIYFELSLIPMFMKILG